MDPVLVIGGGLAGCSAALTLSRLGIPVELHEMRPGTRTPAHRGGDLAQLVCSNSLKGLDVSGAHGLLKEELRIWGSDLISLAFETRVPAGASLAVDREKFSAAVEAKLLAAGNITLIRDEVTEINTSHPTLVAGGPLASPALVEALLSLVGGKRLAFFDAIAPVITEESLDWDHAWRANRWNKGDGSDFINCSLDREQYDAFVKGLVEAEAVTPRPFEPRELFEGCLPIEEMARRGADTLRHGPLRPVGLDDPKTGRWPFAALQLRAENADGTLYNLVGCQTRLRQGEQKRLFGLIPACAHAEFARYGAMHRNTFLEAPAVLSPDFSLRKFPQVFLAGQLTGAEGYTEAIATGFAAAVSLWSRLNGRVFALPEETMLGSLVRHLTAPRDDDAPPFQPMNANFGLLPKPDVVLDKNARKNEQLRRALEAAARWGRDTLPWSQG